MRLQAVLAGPDIFCWIRPSGIPWNSYARLSHSSAALNSQEPWTVCINLCNIFVMENFGLRVDVGNRWRAGVLARKCFDERCGSSVLPWVKYGEIQGVTSDVTWWHGPVWTWGFCCTYYTGIPPKCQFNGLTVYIWFIWWVSNGFGIGMDSLSDMNWHRPDKGSRGRHWVVPRWPTLVAPGSEFQWFVVMALELPWSTCTKKASKTLRQGSGVSEIYSSSLIGTAKWTCW